MRARFFDRQDGEIIRNSKHRAPFLAELVPDTGTTLLIGLGSNGGCAQLLHFLKLGKSTRLERGRKSKLRVVVVQRVEGRGCAVTPAVRHEELGLDAGAAAVDVADEAPRGVEQAGPARHGEEQVVVLVRVRVPAPEHPLQVLAQLLASRLRQSSALVGHADIISLRRTQPSRSKPTSAASSRSAVSGSWTLIVCMPSARADLRFIPMSSRKAVSGGVTPSSRHASS